MVPPAPTTFSMMIGWPSAFDMPAAVTRAIVSVGPPAVNGTIRVIARAG
jgi:hypothetical protein